MQHAGPTLKKIFCDTIRRAAGDQSPLLAWPLACGAPVSAKTSAMSFSEGVLSVIVPDNMWRAQLQLFRQQYIAALNQLTSERVTDIQFVVAGKLKQTKH